MGTKPVGVVSWRERTGGVQLGCVHSLMPAVRQCGPAPGPLSSRCDCCQRQEQPEKTREEGVLTGDGRGGGFPLEARGGMARCAESSGGGQERPARSAVQMEGTWLASGGFTLAPWNWEAAKDADTEGQKLTVPRGPGWAGDQPRKAPKDGRETDTAV